MIQYNQKNCVTNLFGNGFRMSLRSYYAHGRKDFFVFCSNRLLQE